MLKDYELSQNMISLFVDNKSVIDISNNPIQHSRVKYIDIRHHFIRKLVEEKVISLDYVKIEDQLTNILTKTLDSKRFEYLHGAIGLCIICRIQLASRF